MSPLEALLAAERKAPEPADEVRARVARRLEVTLGVAVGATVAGMAQASTGSATAISAVGKSLALKILCGAVLVGGATYVAVQDHRPPPPPPRPAPIQVRHFVAPPPAAPAAALPVAPIARPRPHPHADGLASEQAYLEEARAALMGNAPERALALLGQHERRFPAGQLTEARESLSVQALMAAGRPEAARARAAEFRRRFPRSLFLPAVDAFLSH
jgi:hypothetical protein